MYMDLCMRTFVDSDSMRLVLEVNGDHLRNQKSAVAGQKQKLKFDYVNFGQKKKLIRIS